MAIQPLPQPKIELGKCPFCAKEILTLDRHNNPQRLDGYSEFWVLLSDQSRMKVAICTSCKKKLSKAKVSALMDAHKDFWIKGISEAIDQQIDSLAIKREQQLRYYNRLTSLKHGLSERDLEL